MEVTEDGPTGFLHWLVSPVRLMCAAMWQLTQQESVTHYDLLEESVSLISDTLPDLLSYNERTQLTLGLRARLVLELCGTKTPADPDIIQSHLQRIQTLLNLYKDLKTSDAEGVEEFGLNFVALVQLLMKDSTERNSFFEAVFPVHYGAQFSTALKRLMWQFLSRLENAFPQPTMEDTACILDAAPTVLKKCVQVLLQPEQLKNVYEYKGEVSEAFKDSSLAASTDNCIFTSLGTPQIMMDVQAPIDTNSDSVFQFSSSHSQEVLLETVVTDQFIDSEVEISCSKLEKDANDPICGAEENKECVFQSLDMVDAKVVSELDHSEAESVALQAVKSGLEKEPVTDKQQVDNDKPNQKKEETDPVKLCMLKQAFVNLERLNVSKVISSQKISFGLSKESQGLLSKNNKSEALCKRKRKKNNRPLGLQDVDSFGPHMNKLYSKIKGSSEVYACSLCSFQHSYEIQMHQHLNTNHPKEYRKLCANKCNHDMNEVDQSVKSDKITRTYRGVPICKTCPVCEKTFARGSGMRRHMMSHTSEHPFACPDCGKTFRYTFDLKRHQLNACISKDYVVVVRKKNDHVLSTSSLVHSADLNVSQDAAEARAIDFRNSPRKRPTRSLKNGNSTDSNSGTQTLIPSSPNSMEQDRVKMFEHSYSISSVPVFLPLKRQLRSSLSDSPYKCFQCGISFKYSYNLKKHEDVCVETPLSSTKELNKVTTNLVKSLQSVVCKKLCDENKIIMNDSEAVAQYAHASLSDTGNLIPPKLTSLENKLLHHASSYLTSNLTMHSRLSSAELKHNGIQCDQGIQYASSLKKHEDGCQGKRPSDSDQGPFIDASVSTAYVNVNDLDVMTSVPTDTPSFKMPDLNSKSEEDEQEQLTSQPTKSVHASSLFTCNKCETPCKNLHFLKNHKLICANHERSFKCVKCDAMFKTLPAIKKHLQCHWGEDPQQCSQCGKYFLSSGELAKHTMAHDRVCSYPCTLCSEILERLDALRQHYLDAHDFRGPFQCSHCDRTHKDLGAMVAHMGTHSEDRPFQCSHCPKRFKQRSALTFHEKLHSGDKPYLCEECGKCFTNNIQLQRHLISHRTERPHECPQCKKHFKTHYSLRVHLINHSKLASFSCEVCGKLFTQMAGLVRHLRIHTGERPFSCPKCGKTFLTHYEVGKHMRYHTGERPFQCQQCSKSFTQACYLTTHMRIHTGERPYPCSVCSKPFISSSQVKRHMLVHTKEKPFHCDCGKAFNQKHLIKTHKCSLKKN